MKPNQKVAYSAKTNPTLHYIARSKHLVINDDDLQLFKSFITRRTVFGLVAGPPCSGKTAISKFIA
jgi:type II secretory ATPase GspE/PulE/Tfp pilus assembly ATPase PilB-like protein